MLCRPVSEEPYDWLWRRWPNFVTSVYLGRCIFRAWQKVPVFLSFLDMENNHPSKQDPFAEYLWMENMDDFDREVNDQLNEEEFIRACIEQLLDEEDERETMTAAEIIAQQQLHSLQSKDSVQQGTSQSSYRSNFQGRNVCSNGYTNGYGNHDYNVVVSLILE